MKKALMNNRPIKKWLMLPALFFLAGLLLSSPAAGQDRNAQKLADLETRISAYTVQPGFPDDAYGLIVVNAALEAIKGESGGIGACLVDSRTGQMVETGRNRQFTTYFRSDLHAEMDLLNRYEDRMKKPRSDGKGGNPRECPHLVLISSVEPCPMCLTRIINSGIKTVLYVVEDKQGGMVTRLDQLPPFWREFAADREFRQADCSPELRQIALDLFHFSHRDFARNRKKP